jgi:Domain of Unknown Function (DUF1080)/FG-GAP-like repeat
MFRKRVVWLLTAVAACSAVALMFGGGPTFHPDVTVQGSSLTGWHILGDADWHAQNGEIVGTPKQPGGGWLVLDKSYQDVGFYASFRCMTGCRTGLLLRAEKTADGGMKGIFVSLTDSDRAAGEAPVALTEQGKTGIASYAVTLDAQGKELKRERLRSGGGQMRIAPPLDPNAPARGGRGGGGRGRGPAVALPIPRPDTDLHAGEWNQVEVLIDANIVRAYLNTFGSETGGGVAEDQAGRYGPIALYVGGTGEVHFKDVAYKNLALKVRPAETVSPHFSMQRLSDFYYSWGAGAADINHDGAMDVVSGPHVYYGPDYLTHSEIYAAIANNPSDTYTTDDWMQFVGDFTGDGWADVINCSFSGNPGVWLYVNPKGEARRWDKHLVVPAFNSEIAVVRDLFGDGKLEIVYGGGGFVRYARPDPANPTGPWIVRSVSEAGYSNAHGIGVGDVNGDGRLDILNAFGWWEQPADEKLGGAGEVPWKYHPEPFGRYGRNGVGGSVIGVYDVNGDGLNDVITSLNAHGFGVAWFEQKRDAQGVISFVEHMIMDDFGTKNAGGVTFSEPHGTAFADVDGDGVTDLIVGKRFWSHRDDFLDPDAYGPAVLYWYRTVRNKNAPGGAEFVPELIHNRSGAGSDVFAADLNKDGAMDIVTATRFGTFIFWGKPGAFKGRR